MTSIVLIFLMISMSVPLTNGISYPTFTKAKLRYNGMYSETHNSSADNGFELYLLYCNIGSTLNVTVTFDTGLYINWGIYLLNSTQEFVANSYLPYYLGTDNCTIICNYTGYYYAAIVNNDSDFSHIFTLIISGSINTPVTPPIPGFEFIFVISGVLMSLGIIFFLKNSKKKQSIILNP